MKCELEQEACTMWLDMSKTAQKHCNGGLPDEFDCEWYHGSWCLLRCLGLVSNPFWHENFYTKKVSSFSSKNIAIIGTAGISMPYLVSKLQPSSNISIIDICATPLKSCESFSLQNNLNWNTLKKDIATFSTESNYDLIVNDAFLTRFPKENKKDILGHIAKALQKDGYYITTIRKGIYKKDGYKSNEKDRKKFIEKAIQKGKELFPNQESIIEAKATTYINNMLSFPIEDILEIKNLFNSVDLNITDINEQNVVGESESTIYFQVVAQKK